MKRTLFLVISLYMGLVSANAQVNNDYDVNGDGHVNITDVSKLITFILGQTTPTDNAPCEAVDLGLPSGTKWASCNVGATKPEEYGGYYAWGETEEKDTYSWKNYVHCDGTKATCHDLGSDISVTKYDVAHVKWGGNWRMPTMAEYQELVDNCTSEWITLNGINGCKFTSNINGNSIFLPAAGYRWGNDSLYVDERGYYWSSSQVSTDMSISYDLGFLLGDIHTYWRNVRGGGRSIRPVESPNNTEIIDQNDESVYDLNNDGDVNITDAILLVNYILGKNNDNDNDNGNGNNSPAEAIDLGLPSGTKWASCNVGATKPEEYGSYYAWGETVEYEESCHYYQIGEYEYVNIGSDISGTEYDVAHVKWGGKWCMPTLDDIKELLDNCTVYPVRTYEGVRGKAFVSNINGNGIFLPSAGEYFQNHLSNVSEMGCYWSSTPNDEKNAYYLYFYSSYAYSYSPSVCYHGKSVRPVWKEKTF